MNHRLLNIIQQDHEYRDIGINSTTIIEGNYHDLIHKMYALYQEGTLLQYQYLYLNSGRVFYHLKSDRKNTSLLLLIHQLMEQLLELVQEINQGEVVTSVMKKQYDEQLDIIQKQFSFIQNHYFDRESVKFRPERFIYGQIKDQNKGPQSIIYTPLLLGLTN